MIRTEGNRRTRRKHAIGRGKRMALAGATAAAMTVGLTTAPNAQAIDIDREYTWDPVYSSGLVAGLLDFVSRAKPGVDVPLSDTISFQTGPPPSLGLTVSTQQSISGITANVNVKLNLNLRKIDGDTANLYNTEAGIPQPGCNQGYGVTGGASGYASTCRYALQLASLGSVNNLLNAFRAQLASVNGDTPSGLIPFTSAPNSTAVWTGPNNGSNGPAYTNQGLIFLQNLDRPNGGIAARFPGISNLLGINPDMPDAGKVTSQDGKIALNTTTLDLTWAYDPIGDFPAVFNIPAITNSILGAIPLNIVTGGLATAPLQGSSLGDIGLNLASLLQFPIDFTYLIATVKTLPMADGQAFYSTLVPNVLPITVVTGLPGTVVNFALKALNSKFLLGNPLAEALAPAMKILVNTGYTDVLAPDKLNQCATACGTVNAQTWAQLGYTDYDRTFGAYSAPGSAANAATATPFNSVKPLTREERIEKRRDVVAALVAGVKEQLAKPFLGIIVPNTEGSSAAAVRSTTAAAVPAPNVDEPDAVGVASANTRTPSLRSSSASAVKSTAGKPARSSFDNRNGSGRAAASAAKVRGTR